LQLDDQHLAISSSYLNRIYCFCSLDCKEKFDLDPDSYAIHPAQRSLPDDRTL